jgi:hypothetical protein
VWVVNAEHDPLYADFEQQVEERRREIEAAEGVMHVLPQTVGDRPRKLGHLLGQSPVHPFPHKGDGFAHVADHDLQFGMPVEHAAKDHAQEMDRCFYVPAPAGTREDAGH